MSKQPTSKYKCCECAHEWRARSTDRGNLYFDTHVDACPQCGSRRFEEHFPDGAVMKPYVPKIPWQRRKRGAA